MHRQPTPIIAVPILCAALLLAGCGGDEASGSVASAEPTTSAAAGSETSDAAGVERIPDGRYARVATEAEFAASGLPEGQREELLGPDGEMPTAFEFDGDRWTLYITNDAGVEEIGDLGTLEYDEEGRLVTTSQSTGCPGCVGVLAWTLEGDSLGLDLQGEDVDPIDAFVMDGAYTREG